MPKNIHTKNSGFTLIEMLVYVAVLVGVLLLILNMIVSFTRSYRELSALRSIDQTGITGMERMSRDIRSATAVDSGNSTFGSSNGVLTLTQTSGAVSTTTKFYLQNSVLKVDVNGTYDGPLSVSKSLVTNLTFTLLSSSESTAVKIDMTVQATTTTTAVRSKLFHTTVVLKGAQ